MATTNKTTDKTEAEKAAEAKAAEEAKKAKIREGIASLGRNLNLDKAKRLFGAENAVAAMDAVAKAGGHGAFTEDDYKNPLFGGLQIPDPDTVANDDEKREKYAKRRAAIESALSNLK